MSAQSKATHRNGVDAAALAAMLKQLPKDDSRKLRHAYGQWVLEGATTGRRWIGSAAVIWGLCFAATLVWWPNPLIMCGGAAAFCGGVALFRIGAQKERRWRQANPFRF